MLGTRQTITKKFNFCYSHELPDYNGKCCRNHGHNVELEVTVDGINHPEIYPGMLADFGDVKAEVQPIVESLDHYNLNHVLPENFQPATIENIAQFIWWRVTEQTKIGKHLVKLRLTETPTSWTEIERN